MNTARLALYKDNWCTTQVNTARFRYKWTIKNFSSAHRVLHRLKSSTFSMGSETQQMQWRMVMDGKVVSASKCQEDYISLYLELVSCEKAPVTVRFTFWILNDPSQGMAMPRRSMAATFTKGSVFGFDKYARTDFHSHRSPEITEAFSKDEITILLDIDYGTEQINESSQPEAVPRLTMPDSLSRSLGSLLDDPEFSDVTLSVHGQDFKAHKYILAARSPVFAAMFRSGMQESKNNRVEIEDVEIEVFRQFLKYVYTDKTENLEEMATDLFSIADKYGVNGLKLLCLNAMHKGLTTENAVEILKITELHGALDVKEETIKFLNRNSRDVADTVGFRDLMISHPNLAADVFRARAVD